MLTTRRRFLARAAGSAAGAFVWAGVWPRLGTFLGTGTGPLLLKGVRAELSPEPEFRGGRAAVAEAGGAIVNIAADGEHSPYAADGAERERAIAFSKLWIDVATVIGSPSVRTNIPAAKDSKPDLERTAESLKRVAEYGAAKNVVVNLENDNPVSEDPFFLVKVIEKVNSEWLRALPDFGNSVAAQDDEYAYKGIEGMFGRAYNISHVKETEVGEKGKTAHVDLAKTFGIAKQHGYKGYFSMEWDSPGDPYQGTAGLIEKTLKNLS